MAGREIESYSGESSYKYVDRLIKNNDKELMIVSPYISDYYTRMLLKRAGSKRIRIITSESSMGYKNAILSRYRTAGIRGYMKAIAFLLILDMVSIYLKFAYTTLILSAGALIFALLAYRRHSKVKSNMQVKVARERFVHEKLYIGKEVAIVGSANLTFNGMHRNLEHIEIIRSIERIIILKRHFEDMWKGI